MTYLNVKTKGINILIYSYPPLQLEKHLECAHLCQTGHFLTYCDFYLFYIKYISAVIQDYIT